MIKSNGLCIGDLGATNWIKQRHATWTVGAELEQEALCFRSEEIISQGACPFGVRIGKLLRVCFHHHERPAHVRITLHENLHAVRGENTLEDRNATEHDVSLLLPSELQDFLRNVAFILEEPGALRSDARLLPEFCRQFARADVLKIDKGCLFGRDTLQRHGTVT